METETMSSRIGKPWTVQEELYLLQSLDSGIMPEEIAGNLQRKVGGVNSRRSLIAERLISQGSTLENASKITKLSQESIQKRISENIKKEKIVQTESPKQEGITMELIHKIGNHIGLSMDHYIGRVHTWEETEFLTFKPRETPKGKSLYTLNLKTLRPTQTSPIQKQLNAELELALS
jgi:hypothetical protein